VFRTSLWRQGTTDKFTLLWIKNSFIYENIKQTWPLNVQDQCLLIDSLSSGTRAKLPGFQASPPPLLHPFHWLSTSRSWASHIPNPKQWMHMDQASTPLVTLCHISEFMLMNKSFFIFVAPHAGHVWIELRQAASWLSSDPSPRWPKSDDWKCWLGQAALPRIQPNRLVVMFDDRIKIKFQTWL